MGVYNHPEVSMHTYSLGEYMEYIERPDWTEVGNLMLSSAHKLANAGADFLICPDNTIHQALPYLEHEMPLPWLHIADAVADEANRRGFKRIGITGTQWLIESEVYPERLSARGLAFLRPTSDERREINRIIFEELIHGILTIESLGRFQVVIQNLKDAGADAVVLGCTEIPLLINDSNSPLPTLDSTRLLARAALRRAIGI